MLGSAVAAGDLNGDMNDEVVILADYGEGYGTVWVLEGPDSGARPTDSGAYVARIEGTEAYGLQDAVLLANHDLDGDLVDDLVIGAPRMGSTDAGAVYIFAGPVLGELDLTDATATITGANGGDLFGWALTASDGDGDAQMDLFVGAPGYGGGGVFAWYTGTPLTGSFAASTADVIWEASESGAEFGYSLSAGYIGGSQLVVVGAPGHDGHGWVYGLLNDAGTGEVPDDLTPDILVNIEGNSTCNRCGERVLTGFRFDGSVTDDLIIANAVGETFMFFTPEFAADSLDDADVQWGTGVTEPVEMAWVPDLDNDGDDELLLALADPTGVGAAELVYGDAALAGLPPALISGVSSVTFTAAHSGDYFGDALASGDFNGDGRADVLIGAPWETYDSLLAAGTGRVYYGPFTRLEGTIEAEDSDALVYGDDIGDLSGYSVAGVGDVNCDGVPDVAVGAVLADESSVYTGALYILFGPTPESGPLAWLNTAIDLQDADFVFYETAAGDLGGNTVAGVQDVNGDGCDDFLISAPGDDAAATGAGAAYLFYGTTGLGGAYDPADADATFEGEAANSALGVGLGSAGDFDADGFADLVIGEPSFDGAGTDLGRVLLFYGGEGEATLSGTLNGSDADCRFVGEGNGDRAGWATQGGFDFNGDGYPDVAVGSPGNDDGGSNAGAVYVVRGANVRCSGGYLLGSASLEIRGAQAEAQLGSSLAAANDIDDDGRDDLVIGAPLHNAEVGRAFWVPGNTLTGTHVAPMGGTRLCAGGSYEGRMGWSVAALDLDGNGRDDLVTGVPWATVNGDTKGGLALVWYDDTLTAWKGDSGCHPDTDADIAVRGEVSQDFAGWAVSNGGDLNQDGEDDLLIGAYGNDTSGTVAGAAYLVLSSHLVP